MASCQSFHEMLSRNIYIYLFYYLCAESPRKSLSTCQNAIPNESIDNDYKTL